MTWAVAVLLGVTAVACSGDDDSSDAAKDGGKDGKGEPTTAAEADADAVPGDAWDVVAPADEGMDAAGLTEAKDYAFADGMNTQGVVVVRHGKIVAEWYADGASSDSWAASWSMAKSFTSALVGIAIDEGKIPGVDEPMTTWYPEWKGTPKEKITLRDVLQMSSGLEWNESYDPQSLGTSEIIEMVVGQPDELKYAAGRPAEVDPGTRWSYSSGDAMLLSGVIQKATGMRADEYAKAKLFDRIDIEQVDWWRDGADHTLTYCCLDASSRGFARLGLLYLHHGDWGGEQVVPEQWVDDSLEAAPASEGRYGYQWWLDVDVDPDTSFAAIGHDGQWIYVLPDEDLVVVRNGTYVKDPGPSVADPNLFSRYPSDGLVPGKGTTSPKTWDDKAFLTPIVDSIKARR
jgi:CubicO group peptidase (beta-lactamase class C family)